MNGSPTMKKPSGSFSGVTTCRVDLYLEVGMGKGPQGEEVDGPPIWGGGCALAPECAFAFS
jgi:hypothetical protein